MNSDSVLKIFREITRIPRESGHEELIGQFLRNFAAAHGLACKTDQTGNVLITKEASKGRENVPTLVLQSHQDMVCEKLSGSSHDFDKDPIDYVIEDGWMIAKETTLGADDGIGIAASLALLESDVPCGKIECLFTISEETGMNGAMDMKEGFFTGKTLINLDSEDEGQLFVGCAGGMDSTATFEYEREPLKPEYKCVSLHIFGCQGGHSGDDINKERCNAVQQLARFIYAEKDWQLLSFIGGGKYNAIARECSATLAVPDAEETIRRFLSFGETLKAEFAVSDSAISVNASVCDTCEKAIGQSVAGRFISALVSVHHGVLAMSQDIPGLVETSSNLAAVRMPEEGKLVVCTSQRSSVDSAKAWIADKVGAAFLLAGASIVRSDPYPGWKPNMDSNILKVSVDSYERLFGVKPEVKAIHAGLECGLFLEKFHDLDMISFGQTLRGVHTPGEKLDLKSNEKFVSLLVDIVSNFR